MSYETKSTDPSVRTDLIEQLRHRSSRKRCVAAKKIRKLKIKEVGPDLLTALKSELQDVYNWEAQYQMILALGDIDYIAGIDFLLQLAEQRYEESMIFTAVGNVVTQLEILTHAAPISLWKWIHDDKKELVDGCLHFIAIQRMMLSEENIQKIIQYISLPENYLIQVWAVAAMSGWPKELTTSFLKDLLESIQIKRALSSGDEAYFKTLQKTAKAALKGKYIHWKPL